MGFCKIVRLFVWLYKQSISINYEGAGQIVWPSSHREPDWEGKGCGTLSVRVYSKVTLRSVWFKLNVTSHTSPAIQSVFAYVPGFSPCLCSWFLSLPAFLVSLLACVPVFLCIWGNHECLNWAAALLAAREQQATTPLTRHNTPSSHVGWKLGAKRRTHRHRNRLSENLGISNIDIKATFA